jgi:hypothetical protein
LPSGHDSADPEIFQEDEGVGAYVDMVDRIASGLARPETCEQTDAVSTVLPWATRAVTCKAKADAEEGHRADANEQKGDA